jgi:hypothetical protein
VKARDSKSYQRIELWNKPKLDKYTRHCSIEREREKGVRGGGRRDMGEEKKGERGSRTEVA